MRRRPSPRAQARMFASCPAMLLIKVTFRDLSLIPLTHDFLDALAALGGDVVRRAELAERVHGRPHHVDGIARSVALGEHVAHARALEHGAHAAAGDHAGTVRGRLHVDARRTVLSFDRVEQRVVLERYVHQALARLHHGLRYGHRYLARLAVAEAHASGAVAHHGEGGG